MSFLYQTHNAFSPPGTIAQYIGTTDPDGWIICNGVLRTEQDGRFEALAKLLNEMTPGSSHTKTNCTPPNLSGRVLYGKSGSVLIGSTGGALNQTLLEDHLPSHTHVVKDPTHTHVVNVHSHTFEGKGHSHNITDGVNNEGHAHDYQFRKQSGQNGQGGPKFFWTNDTPVSTGNSKANISINPIKATGSISTDTASITSGKAGIIVENAGSGTAFDITPPYFVVHYIIKY